MPPTPSEHTMLQAISLFRAIEAVDAGGDAMPHAATTLPTPACDAVFGLPEMLESILNFLPRKSLLPLKRTCKYFKATIEGSAKFERDLFLRPVPWSGAPPEACILNEGEDWEVIEDKSGYPFVELNPLLMVNAGYEDGREGGEIAFWFSDMNKNFNSESSMSRMVLTRPLVPGLFMDLYVSSNNDSRVDDTYCTLDDDATSATFRELKLEEEMVVEEEFNWMHDGERGFQTTIQSSDDSREKSTRRIDEEDAGNSGESSGESSDEGDKAGNDEANNKQSS